MKITIAEAGSSKNIGSMALIENSIKIAKQIDNNCVINVLTNDLKCTKESLNNSTINLYDDLFVFPSGKLLNKVMWIINTFVWILLVKLILCFTKKPYKYLIGRKAKVLKSIANSDYVLCIGAERINDVYYKTAYLSLEALDLYERMGVKLIHLSLTIGPVFYKSTIRKAQKVLNKSYAIFVRDQKSFNLLTEFKICGPKIYNTYDIAILQDCLTDGKNLLERLGINDNVEYVCVSVINWIFRKVKGPIRQDEYNKAVAETIDYIIEKYKLKIVFTPTVVGLYDVDDVKAAQNIIKLIKNKNEVIEIKCLLSPKEMATIFSRSKFSIVTRMHAAILCTAAGGKPIISINYLYKLREYMRNIDFENYSVDIDYTNTDDLKKFVDMMMKHYEINLINLNNRIKLMQDNLRNSIINCFLEK